MILLSSKVHGIGAAKSLMNDSNGAVCSNTFHPVLSVVLSSSSSVTHFIFGGKYACFFLIGTGHRARNASFGRTRKGQWPKATSTSALEYVTGPL